MSSLGTLWTGVLFALGVADLCYLNIALVPQLDMSAAQAPREADAVTVNADEAPADETPVLAAPVPLPSSDSADLSADPPLPAETNALEPDGEAEKPELAVALNEGAVEVGERHAQGGLELSFRTASWALSRRTRAELQRLATKLRHQPDRVITVVGHADAVGPERSNYRLGRRRARAVMAYLESQGIARERLRWRSLGETEPKVAGSSEDALARNRRVEISESGGRR